MMVDISDRPHPTLSMNPRKDRSLWQQVAHRVKRADSGFAIAQPLGNSDTAPDDLHVCKDGGQHCYPFPSPWSGPARVGPFFPKSKRAFGRVHAICVKGYFFWFVFAGLAVESSSITTNNRGRKTSCGKPSFSWRFFQCPLLAVCKTRPAVALRGLLRVRHLPILPITMRLPARLSVVWRGLRHVALTSVCRRVIDLTSGKVAFLAALLTSKFITRSSGKIPRLAAFAFLAPIQAFCRSPSHV